MAKNFQPVMSVSEIHDVSLIKTNPPGLIVTACGMVGSSGWSSGRLISSKEYVTPPADGIWEMEFVAKPPKGIALTVVVPIFGTGIIEELPDWVVGIRVISRTNDLEMLFPNTKPAILDIDYEELSHEEREDYGFAPSAPVEAYLAETLDETASLSLQGKKCSSFVLASVSGWPETKVEWKVKCIAKNPFNGKCIAKTDVPIFYKRTSKLKLIAEVCYPSEHEIVEDLKDCVGEAVAAGVAIGVLTSGNLGAAALAFERSLVECLKRKLGINITQLQVRLRREKQPGPWKRV